MDIFEETRRKLTEKLDSAVDKTKKASKQPGFGWEVGAYAMRIVPTATPAIVITCLENSWVKTGLGLTATLIVIALLIIMREPISKAMGYAPGVVPFAVFVALGIFFKTAANALLIIGGCGLGGCVLSIPLHLKYLSCQSEKKSPELQALEKISEAVEALK